MYSLPANELKPFPFSRYLFICPFARPVVSTCQERCVALDSLNFVGSTMAKSRSLFHSLLPQSSAPHVEHFFSRTVSLSVSFASLDAFVLVTRGIAIIVLSGRGNPRSEGACFPLSSPPHDEH